MPLPSLPQQLPDSTVQAARASVAVKGHFTLRDMQRELLAKHTLVSKAYRASLAGLLLKA